MNHKEKLSTILDIEFNVMLKALIVVLTFYFIFPVDKKHIDAEDMYLSKINYLVDNAHLGTERSCSGTVIDKDEGIILTSWHCVGLEWKLDAVKRVWQNHVIKDLENKSSPITIKTKDGGIHVFDANVVAWNRNYDLALIDVKDSNFKFKTEAKILPEDGKVIKGETVYFVGNPLGLYASLNRGIVSAFRKHHFPIHKEDTDLVEVIQYSGGTTGGNSGGALYNKHGMLIGNVAATQEHAQFIGLAVSYKVINKFLAESCYGYIVNKKNKEYCNE